MALSLAQNAIALLIDLAERGEIDPWDVQVIEVIDRFLSKLQPPQERQMGRAAYEADLSESGQAFLYASMLLLLKADSLARMEAQDTEAEDLDADGFLAMEGFASAALPPNLERKIRRRATAQPVSNRRVTLQELITQLNLMAAAMAQQQPRSSPRRARPQSRTQAIRAITQLAHQENLSEVAAALEQFLQENWQTIEQGQDWVDFELLLQAWTELQAQSAKSSSANRSTPTAVETHSAHERVGVFWALLFLSSQSKVELEQEEFYQDLKVRRLTATSLEAIEAPPFSLPD